MIEPQHPALGPRVDPPSVTSNQLQGGSWSETRANLQQQQPRFYGAYLDHSIGLPPNHPGQMTISV